MIITHDFLHCTKLYVLDRAVGSTKWHKQLCRDKAKDLRNNGVCYCYNYEQKNDIIKLAKLDPTDIKVYGDGCGLYLEVI